MTINAHGDRASLAQTLLLLLCLSCPLRAAERDGAAVFAGACRSCHQAESATRAPAEEALRRLPRERILTALESGSMKAQGDALTPGERAAVALFLAIKPVGEVAELRRCAVAMPALRETGGWQGWGVDLANTRHAVKGGIKAADVPRLKLKWQFAFPGANAAYGQPTVVDGRLFVGSDRGTVYAFDAKSGCVYWTFAADATVRTAMTVWRGRLYFGDLKAHAYAVNALDGRLVWKTKVEEHPLARITGSPALHDGRLYVPVSSVEEVAPANVKYECCKFRGSLVMLDAASGAVRWKRYTIPDEPKPTRVNAAGTQLHGPAGAAVWIAPTIDARRKLVYVATGNGYADPANGFTDAVIAFDGLTGERRWVKQLTEGDGWNFSCSSPNKANCPEAHGEDFDIGAPLVLGRWLYVGQKSGIVYALNPEANGKVVWQTRVGHGGALGGIQWGMAMDGKALYVPLSDFGVDRRKPEVKPGGLFALDLSTGEKLWATLPPKPVAFQAAASVSGGVVFAAAMDGVVRAYGAAKGDVLWEFNTRAMPGGGSVSGGGPVVAEGMVFVMSGYGALGGMAGNVLLAFGVGN